ncbi:MAG: hypothetical protein WCC87_16860 [Candidatus Korobacteraceae bacterium]
MSRRPNHFNRRTSCGKPAKCFVTSTSSSLHPSRDGYSKVVSNGSTIFTLIGFIGLYFVLGLLFLFLVGREIAHGPDEEAAVDSRASVVTGRVKEQVVA